MTLPFAQQLYDRIHEKLQNGELQIQSRVDAVPTIGKWLTKSIARSLNRNANDAITLRDILAFIAVPLPNASYSDTIVARLLQLCQNKRGSRCVLAKRNRSMRYLVRDVNKGCALALPMVLRALLQAEHDAGTRNHNALLLALNRAVARVRTRETLLVNANERFSPTAQCECLNEPRCRSYYPHCQWNQANGRVGGERPQCTPYVGEGYEGLPPFTAQVIENTGSLEEDFRLQQRGQYGPEVNRKRWRRDSLLSHVTPSDQRQAFAMQY